MNDIISCTWDDIRDFFEEGQIEIQEYEIIENKRKENENKILRKVVEE